MTARSAKAAGIMRILDRLYPDPAVPLRYTDAYTLLVAAVLSAQTTDAAVNRVTPRLFRRAPTPARMMRLPVATIRSIIRSVGLAPTKARHIRALSRILVERHGGRVPKTFEELEALPGVGHKTASVIMSQIFGVAAFPVDTHIHRLARRWGISDGRSVERTEADLKRFFPERAWRRLHLQMIYYGRERCPARGHDLARCPVCRRWGRDVRDDCPERDR